MRRYREKYFWSDYLKIWVSYEEHKKIYFKNWYIYFFFFLICHDGLQSLFNRLEIVDCDSWRCVAIMKNIMEWIISIFGKALRSTKYYTLKIGINNFFFFLIFHYGLQSLFNELKIVDYDSWRCYTIVKNISNGIISRFGKVLRSTKKYTLKIGINIFFLFFNLPLLITQPI